MNGYWYSQQRLNKLLFVVQSLHLKASSKKKKKKKARESGYQNEIFHFETITKLGGFFPPSLLSFIITIVTAND